HDVLSLLLRSHEQDHAALPPKVPYEVVRLLEAGQGLLQVNDVDARALPEQETLHLGIPTAGLVAEVDAGLEQLPSRGDRHEWMPPFGSSSAGSPRPGPQPTFCVGHRDPGAGPRSCV